MDRPTTPAAEGGQIYRWLVAATQSGGSQRSVDSQEATLSRRGLLIRADKRARELAGLKIGAGDVVALSMGNVPEFLVLLLAVSKLGAVVMPVDPANGDRSLLGACARLRVRAVIRRPRGLENAPLCYPEGYRLTARRKLSGSLLDLDVLEPPQDHPGALPEGTEFVFETAGADGTLRDIARTGAHLQAIGEATRELLGLDAGTHIACAQPLTSPRFFDPVLFGWLASEARLVIADNPSLLALLLSHPSYERLVVVDLLYNFQIAARDLKAAGLTRELTAVLPQATIATSHAKPLKQAFGADPIQLLLLEEVGVLAARTMKRNERYRLAPGIELRPGEADEGEREVLCRSALPVHATPAPPAGEVGSPADEPGWMHTGYLGRFTAGELAEVPDRNDRLVNLEGRRASLDAIEAALRQHRRITWVEAVVESDVDGNPHVHAYYRATGVTPLDDLDEHAVATLPPYLVPRLFTREEDDDEAAAAT
ncbi:MAG TPA: class I adenylate-forming enzyme family protein [Nannocystaceae bacterium]|nr:class I adenylate-forming enzyme family protein [Nannocystaceae bacterium]